MQFKSVAALLLSTAATGAVAQQITPPPASILTVLETALPSSLITELTNPSAIQSVVSEVAAGTVPGWLQSLPPNVKSYLVTAYGSLASVAVPSSAASLASSALSVATATPTASAESSGSASSSAGSSTASSSAGSSSAASGHASATSTGGAPAATGALALGLAGAAGVLGLAVAL
ncbi:hypothetical protein VTN96DRAFT_266 [Rasamsonia emersonii]